MIANVVALSLTGIICVLVPLVVLGIIMKKNSLEKGGVFLAFLSGAIVYLIMEWGIKEHGLQMLFKKKAFVTFVNEHYILYLLAVAFAGALLAVLAECFIAIIAFKRQMSFGKIMMFGLGYAMLEAVMLVGYRSILTLVELAKGTEAEISTTTTELFLAGYERILMMIIHIAITVVLVYFIEQKKSVLGVGIAVFCQMMAAFLPGFFIAFSTERFYEMYTREWALLLVYIVLTMSAICGIVVLNSLKYYCTEKKS